MNHGLCIFTYVTKDDGVTMYVIKQNVVNYLDFNC